MMNEMGDIAEKMKLYPKSLKNFKNEM